MRTTILLTAISLVATIVSAADNLQPLNVKPGLWQVTTTTTIQGMGAPETRSYKSCVTNENAKGYPFGDRDNDCKYTVESSTGTHMAVSGICLTQGQKADFKIELNVIDSENVRGTGHLTLAGPQANMHGEYTGTGKWIGATCPAGMK